MAPGITPFLMFDGVAGEALALYTTVFRNSEIRRIERYGPGEAGAEGSVKRAVFTLAGQEFICIDSPVRHAFTFTPSVSLFVECDSESEFASVFQQLSADGQVLMPPGDYGFGTRFAWFNDRFGVSWQLTLEWDLRKG